MQNVSIFWSIRTCHVHKLSWFWPPFSAIRLTYIYRSEQSNRGKILWRYLSQRPGNIHHSWWSIDQTSQIFILPIALYYGSALWKKSPIRKSPIIGAVATANLGPPDPIGPSTCHSSVVNTLCSYILYFLNRTSTG